MASFNEVIVRFSQMPINRKRYAANWNQVALQVKEAAGWRCQRCGCQCLLPGENLVGESRVMRQLSVHHADFTPENNAIANLIPLCTPCHIALHGRARGRSNTSPGQLELPLN